MSQENIPQQSLEERHFEAEGDALLQGKRRSEQKENPRLEVVLDGSPEKLGVTGSLLHLHGSCKLRTLHAIKKTPAETPPTLYSRERQKDGDLFEAELLATPKIWQRLLGYEYGTPDDLELFSKEMFKLGKRSGEKRSLHQKAVIEEMIAANPGKAILFEQIWVRDVDPFTGHLSHGVADLALWANGEWHLGEIKSSAQPRASAALQLDHYHGIWKTWAPNGDKLSPKVFILHPQIGWEYQCQASAKRRNECMEAVQISIFPLDIARAAHTDAITEIHELHAVMHNPPEEIACSPLNQDCSECRHRISCFKRFAEDTRHPDGPHISTAGFDESEQAWLTEDLGITRTRTALVRIKELGLLHQDNPVTIADLKSRLINAEMLSGTFSWAAPHTNYPPLFYGRPAKKNHPAWVMDGEALTDPSSKLSASQAFILVTFTEHEMRRAYGELAEKGFRPQTIICLQDELDEETLLPFENLTLNGITETLQGILEEGSWADYFERRMMTHMIEHPDRKELIRAYAVSNLWDAMHELTRLTAPEF